MEIRFVDLKSQYSAIKNEIDSAIQSVIGDAAFIGGKYLESFLGHFAEYVGAKHCIGVGNGTDALYVAMKCLGIGRGDEVITAANSFIATSEAITMTGARVVFVDCDEQTYNIDVNKIEKHVTDKTKAIVPVHLYGQPAEMDAINDIAGRYGLSVIEDAAQAHGARYKGRNVGTLGDISCFSFFPGKNLGAYGDGGAIVTDNDDLARKMRMYANHGRIDKYNHEFEGINSRLDGMQAAILDVKLRYLESWTERRIAIARQYSKALEELSVTPIALPDMRHVYHLYVVRVKQRQKISSFLAKKGIATGIHYPIPLPFLQAYGYLGYSPEDFPVAYSLKDEILSIPIHGNMKDQEVDYVISNMNEALTS